MTPLAPSHGRRPPGARRQAFRPWLALAVLALGILVSQRLWHQAQALARQRVEAYFAFRVRDAMARLEERLATYEQVLRGGRGLFRSSREVSRAEWAAYVGSLGLTEHYPGIQGVGFALRVPAAERAAHEAAVRAEGFPGYAIRPPGLRDPASAILYLEPFAGRNLRAFGYDMFSEAVRREAMGRAWRSGETALSGWVTLVQETDQDIQAGFLMYLPVYRNGRPQGTEADRLRNLVGWVYAPFRVNDFMAGVLGEQEADLDIEVVDGTDPGMPMYDHDPRHEGLREDLTATRRLAFGGRAWTVTLRALPALETRLGRDTSVQVLGLGLLGSLLLAGAAWSLALGRDRAVALAESRRFQMEAERLQHQEAIGVLARGLAHDFNNLLQSILSSVDLARMTAGEDSPAGKVLGKVAAGAAVAKELSERLYLLGERREVMEAAGPLGPVLRPVLAEGLAGSEVKLVLDLADEAVPIRYHEAHLRQAFGHVVANAREAMEGRGTLRVACRAVDLGPENAPGLPPGPYVHLTFTDSGPGLEAPLLPLIFQPYFSTKQCYSQKGLGLGLALCRIILHHHGGAIGAESRPGEGATFHLHLPRVADRA